MRGKTVVVLSDHYEIQNERGMNLVTIPAVSVVSFCHYVEMFVKKLPFIETTFEKARYATLSTVDKLTIESYQKQSPNYSLEFDCTESDVGQSVDYQLITIPNSLKGYYKLVVDKPALVSMTANNANEQVDEKKPSFFDRIGNFFHRDSKPQEAEEVTNPQWDGMETAPAPNGSGWTVLPGNHFDQYSDIDKNYEDHPRTAIPKDEQEYKRVNPADIEGVALGDSEVENPDRFWGMHNGSKEDWMNTASQIPEVQQRLDNGESLDSLLDDDQLGRCAQAYFNPDSSKATKSRATQFKEIATAQSSSADVKRRRSRSFPPCWDAKPSTPATPANRAAEKPRTA